MYKCKCLRQWTYSAVLNKIHLVWNVALCRLVSSDRRFGELQCLYLRSRCGLGPEDGGTALFRNVGNYSLADMT
jgi:hypothetical protein